MRKILILIIFVIFASVVYPQTGWINLNSGVSYELRGLYFLNENTGWITGFSSNVIKTTNGGNTWITQNAFSTGGYICVYFYNEQTGWVGGGHGTNGVGVICKTTNGGNNWFQIFYGNTGIMKNCFFLNSTTGWFASDYGNIFKTTDAGLTFTIKNVASYDWNGIHFINENTGWITGQSGIISKSTNGGISWIPQNSGIISDLNSIHFPNPNTGWAAGSAGKILWTSNGGSNWYSQNGYTGKYLTAVKFLNHATGWIVGDEGTIIKTVDGGGTVGINIISTEIPSGFSLSQNYPNPFNPVTKIRYSVPKSSFISLKIFDVMGREVAVLVNQNQNVGTYEYTFNISEHSNIPSGVLFYRLQSENNFIATKKMILLK